MSETSDPGGVPALQGPVAVLGAGTMGHGIAQVAAMAGYETRLYDVDSVALAKARERVKENLDKGVDLGKVEPETREEALKRLSTTTNMARAAAGARFVLEAVPERIELKQRVLRDAARHAAGGEAAPATGDDDEPAVLASNTSSISITSIAGELPRRERVIGLHFFNPAHIMELVEVVRGEQSAGEVVERGRAFAESLGKTPIVVRDTPGFASSRLGVALGLEAIRMVEEGVASPEDIDAAMTLGYRHPMGPLKLTDLVGLDIRLEVARYLHRELGERFRPPALLEEMVEEGRLGQKTGRGFYEW